MLWFYVIRTYYKATSADLVILPGKSAYKDVQITYAETRRF